MINLLFKSCKVPLELSHKLIEKIKWKKNHFQWLTEFRWWFWTAKLSVIENCKNAISSIWWNMPIEVKINETTTAEDPAVNICQDIQPEHRFSSNFLSSNLNWTVISKMFLIKLRKLSDIPDYCLIPNNVSLVFVTPAKKS